MGYDSFASGPRAGADAGANSAPEADRGVTVHSRGAVGPYDASVLSSASADALRTWLSDNEYDLPDAALGLLDHYVEKGDSFVALRLQAKRDTGEIQPVVLRYEEEEPCIPIRLTAIATVPDMPITAYVLGDSYARSTNFSMVQPDLEDPNLWLGGQSYVGKVTQAVDAAGGQAFVTDYAGDSPQIQIELPSIEDLRTTQDPGSFLQALQNRGFTGDSQLQALLQRFIPPPENMDAQQFYNCLAGGWCGTEVDQHLADLAFDPEGLVDAINEAIVTPREEGQALVAAHPKLTRLFTTMSADEMTVDPLFTYDSSMSAVSNVHEATLTTHCSWLYFHWSAPQSLTMPSGSSIRVREGMAYTASDSQYCEDVQSGTFGPFMSRGAGRELESGGVGTGEESGICAVTAPGAGASTGLTLVGLVASGLLLWRRRRR
jgi:hypothetical protein